MYRNVHFIGRSCAIRSGLRAATPDFYIAITPMKYEEIADYPLSQDQLDELNSIIRGYDPYHVRIRAQAILLMFADHRSLDDVASFCRVHGNTVRTWAKRWIDCGIDGLYYTPGRGAKPIFSRTEKDFIVGYVKDEPRSLRKVAQIVEQVTGKLAGLETFRRIVKDQGKSWKRQRKIPKKEPEKEEYEKGKADLDELRQLANDGEFTLYYFDVAGFSLVPEVPYAWQDLGRKGTIGIPTSRSKRINVLGFMNPVGNELRAIRHIGSVNSDVIIAAIDAFCDDLPGPAVMNLDNAPVHTSEAVSARIDEWEKRGLTLYFLPRYSPELNLIEILWRKIKYEWIPAWAYTNFASLEDALKETLNAFGGKYRIDFSHC
jgi:transposase